jgi:hypothetical protein
MKSFKRISFLLSFFICASCSDELDFNQLDDYVNTPVITSALGYFTIVPAKFFNADGTVQGNSIVDISEFRGFEQAFIRDNVVKLVLNSEFRNEFDRDVTIRIDFLNNNGIITHRFEPAVIQSNDLNPSPFSEEIIIASNRNVLNTTQLRITVELEDTGTQMNPSDVSEFELKSAITFYLESKI